MCNFSDDEPSHTKRPTDKLQQEEDEDDVPPRGNYGDFR
jgi:hypothetical protein